MPKKKGKGGGRKKHRAASHAPATAPKATPESSQEDQVGPKDEVPQLAQQLSTTTVSSSLSPAPESEQESQQPAGPAAEDTKGAREGRSNLVQSTHGSPSSNRILDISTLPLSKETGTGTPSSNNFELYTPLAQRTRSSRPLLVVSSSADWEAPIIAQRKIREETQQPTPTQVPKSEPQTSSSVPTTTRQKTDTRPAPTFGKPYESQQAESSSMSRSRQRGPPSRDNGEEISIKNKLAQDLTKAQAIFDKQHELALKVYELDQNIHEAGNKPSLEEISQLEDWQKQIAKLAEQETKMLHEPPADLIKNMEVLAALRSHSESNTAPGKHRKRKTDTTDGAADSPGPSVPPVSEKIGRLKSASNRSASVSSAQARDGEASEGTKGTAAEKGGRLLVGAEVMYRHKKHGGMEGEGIQCIIKRISGEGKIKRYEVQDPEPNENGEEGEMHKTFANALIPIPQVGANLPSFSAGKQVLARYPDTTTFYRAEVVGSKKEVYRLRFEGEEDDKEMEVDRRFVLDVPGR